MQSNGFENFVMLHQEEFENVFGLISERRLELRDMAVYVGLISEMNWRTGRVRLTARALARKLNIKDSVCVMSLGRLKKELLVVRVREKRSGDVYFLLNPHFASVGGVKRRGYLQSQFEEAINDL
jgi:predicted transcriptional regulator|tara:strand:- start:1453 stop:1827 length:375 start_codon:yes stop_codon:yes gene_type:complete